MPHKIQSEKFKSPSDHVDDFRHKIKSGECWSPVEVAKELGTTDGAVRAIIFRHKWGIPQFTASSGNMQIMLVNPKDLAKYAAKN